MSNHYTDVNTLELVKNRLNLVLVLVKNTDVQVNSCMTLYWYSEPYKTMKPWTEVVVGKILSKGQQYPKIRMNILRQGHQIDIQFSEHDGFTEILSPNLAINLIEKSIEFSPEPELSIDLERGGIKTLPYTEDYIDDFLRDENVLFNLFEDGSWIVLKWHEEEDKLIISTLYTLPQDKLIFTTKKEYPLT